MEKELFIIGCTFSWLGTKETFLAKYPEKKDIVFEVNEFEGTDEEHHSGTFTELISVNIGHKETETLIDVVKDYFNIHNPEFIGESFTVVTMNTTKILTEDDINFK